MYWFCKQTCQCVKECDWLYWMMGKTQATTSAKCVSVCAITIVLSKEPGFACFAMCFHVAVMIKIYHHLCVWDAMIDTFLF